MAKRTSDSRSRNSTAWCWKPARAVTTAVATHRCRTPTTRPPPSTNSASRRWPRRSSPSNANSRSSASKGRTASTPTPSRRRSTRKKSSDRACRRPGPTTRHVIAPARLPPTCWTFSTAAASTGSNSSRARTVRSSSTRSRRGPTTPATGPSRGRGPRSSRTTFVPCWAGRSGRPGSASPRSRPTSSAMSTSPNLRRSTMSTACSRRRTRTSTGTARRRRDHSARWGISPSPILPPPRTMPMRATATRCSTVRKRSATVSLSSPSSHNRNALATAGRTHSHDNRTRGAGVDWPSRSRRRTGPRPGDDAWCGDHHGLGFGSRRDGRRVRGSRRAWVRRTDWFRGLARDPLHLRELRRLRAPNPGTHDRIRRNRCRPRDQRYYRRRGREVRRSTEHDCFHRVSDSGHWRAGAGEVRRQRHRDADRCADNGSRCR